MRKTRDTFSCDWTACTELFVDDNGSIGDLVAPFGWSLLHMVHVGPDPERRGSGSTTDGHLCPKHTFDLARSLMGQSALATPK